MAKVLAKTILTIFLLGLLLRTLERELLWSALASADLTFLAAALSLSLPFILLKAYKWHVLARERERDVRFTTMVKAYMLGVSFGILTPGSVGEMARIRYLGVRKTVAATMVLFDKCMDLLAILLWALLGLSLVAETRPAVLILAGMAALLIASSNIGRLASLLERTFPRLPVQRVRSVLFIPESSALVNRSLLLSVITYFIPIAQCHLILRALGVGGDFLAALIGQPLIMLVNVVQITIGGLGLREGVAVFVFARFEIAPEAAFGAGLLIFLVARFFIGVTGLVFLPGFLTVRAGGLGETSQKISMTSEECGLK